MSWLRATLKSEPPTRGFFDEDSIDEEASIVLRSYNLKFDYKAYDSSLNLLIVSTSSLAKEFVDVYVSPENINPSHVEIGHITQQKILNTDSSVDLEEDVPMAKHEEDSIVAKFFKISDSVLHCHVMKEISSDDLNEFTGVLLSLDNPGISNNLGVVVLTSYPLANYQCNEDNLSFDGPLQRCLLSPSIPLNFETPCKLLEQPNVINAVPASILTERTFTGKPCLLLLNYTDSDKADSITLSGFSSFFAVPKTKQLVSKVSNNISAARLRKLHATPSMSENIFM